MRHQRISMRKRTYHLVETMLGDSYVTSSSGTMTTEVLTTGDNVAKRTKLDITSEQFVAYANQSKTHTLKFDTISGKVMATPRHTKTNTETEAS